MERYSNLNVYGNIQQQAAQGKTANDVVKYSTFNPIIVDSTTPYVANTTYYKGSLVLTSNGLVYLCKVNTPSSDDDFAITGKVYSADGTTLTLAGTQFSQTKNVVTAGTGITVGDPTASPAVDPSEVGSTTQVPKVKIDTFGRVVGIDKVSIQITESQVTNLESDLGSKVSKTPNASKVYATTAGTGTVTDQPLTYGTAATAEYIVQRRTGGQITVPTTPDEDTDAASKYFVNSSIATETANFKGTYDVVSDLGLTESATTAQVITALNNKNSWKIGGNPTNNDYIFVQFDLSQDPGNVDRYDRYKFSGVYGESGATWAFEYTLNNSSFTAAQWAAINSTITSGKVGTYDAYTTTLAVKLKVGASNSATANAAVASSTNSIYMNQIQGTSVVDSHQIVGSGATTVASDANGKITIASSDTHYTAVPVLGGSDATSNATSATSNPYLNIVENSAKSGGVQVTGSGGTTVSAANGVLTITSPSLGNGATNAAYGNHTHTTTLATSSGTSALTMTANTKYSLTAGGTSFIFTTPFDYCKYTDTTLADM